MTVFFGMIIGICVFAGINHLLVGQRSAQTRLNRALALFAFAAAFYVFTSFFMVTTGSLDTFRFWARVEGLAGGAMVASLLWFANVVLRDRVRGVVLTAAVVLAGVGVASLLMPAGIFYGEVTGLRSEMGLLGAVNQPVAEPNPYQWIFNTAAYLPALWVMGRFVQVYREGERLLALLAGVAVLLLIIPAVIDTYLLGVDTFAIPVLQIGLALSLIFLSTVVTEEVARTAGLRERLARTEVRYRWLVESAPDAIAVFDPRAQRFILSNPQAETLFGLEKEALRAADGRRLLDEIETAPGEPGVGALVQRALDGERLAVECTFTRDGVEVPYELRLSPLPSPGGQLVRVGLADISERKAAEAERARMSARLERSETLQTIGTLAEGIAHDFNNVLTPIVGCGELATAQIEPDHPAVGYVAEMRESGGRARELVRQILSYTRGRESGETVFTLEPVVKQAIRFVRAVMPPGIEVERHLEAPDARIRGVPSEAHQIIMNLALNASHAIEDAGTFTVSLHQDGDHVKLAAADTGTGMDAETMSRIWDPFFTTKSDHGTGLGLSNVRGIVERWGGTIEVESELGVGTRFEIRFPQVDDSATGEVAARELRSGSETVLLVDDDTGVLEAVRRMLDSLGYTVLAHDDPEAALQSLGPGELDLCVTDFDMPQVSGVTLADRVRQAFPGLPVVLISGSAEGLERQPATPGPWVALLKPFGRPELSDALRAALDG
jgi:PAS domain S-box-containing protein